MKTILRAINAQPDSLPLSLGLGFLIIAAFALAVACIRIATALADVVS